jgi:hypothetical protein
VLIDFLKYAQHLPKAITPLWWRGTLQASNIHLPRASFTLLRSGFKVRTVRRAAESNVRSLNLDGETLSNGGVRQTTSRASRSMVLRDKRHVRRRQLFELVERGEVADHSYNPAEVMQPISWYGPYLVLHGAPGLIVADGHTFRGRPWS